MNISYLHKEIDSILQAEELKDCFWVDGRIQGSKIEVFIDKDGGISFDICKKVSRQLEAKLDESLVFGDNYTLDISSPGIGSPLKLPRQYANNIGRTIAVSMEGMKILGILKSASSDSIEVETEEVVKEGNKKVKNIINHKIALDSIIEAKIKVSFK